MRYFIFPLIFTLLTTCCVLPAAGEEDPIVSFERARTLAKEGKHAEALVVLEIHRKALRPNARLNRWSIDFKGQAVPVVLVGRKHLYYTVQDKLI